MTAPKWVKCVAVGNTGVGKTYMLCTFRTGTFPWYPQYYDNPIDVIIQEETYRMELTDTSGSDEYVQLRPLSYSRPDVFLLCFSIDSPESFSSIESQWVPEVKQHAKHTPLILVGTKSDLRDDQETIQRLSKRGQKLITTDQGTQLAQKIKAVCYIECSALKQTNLRQVFEKAATVGTFFKNNPHKKRKKCCVL